MHDFPTYGSFDAVPMHLAIHNARNLRSLIRSCGVMVLYVCLGVSLICNSGHYLSGSLLNYTSHREGQPSVDKTCSIPSDVKPMGYQGQQHGCHYNSWSIRSDWWVNLLTRYLTGDWLSLIMWCTMDVTRLRLPDLDSNSRLTQIRAFIHIFN